MMAGYINRQTALDAFGLTDKTRKYGDDHSGYRTLMLYEVQDVLESLLAADVAPVRHGHWLHSARTDRCSLCGWETGKYESPSRYCPGCGAKMDRYVKNESR